MSGSGAAGSGSSVPLSVDRAPDLGLASTAWSFGGPNFLPFRVMLLAKMLDRVTTRLLQAAAGLTVAEWRVLALLAGQSPSTVRQLAEAAWVDRAEVSRAAPLLERRGLLERRDNPKDRRSPLLYCTKSGREMFEKVHPMRREFHASLTAHLNPDQRETLESALAILAEQCVTQWEAHGSTPRGRGRQAS